MEDILFFWDLVTGRWEEFLCCISEDSSNSTSSYSLWPISGQQCFHSIVLVVVLSWAEPCHAMPCSGKVAYVTWIQSFILDAKHQLERQICLVKMQQEFSSLCDHSAWQDRLLNAAIKPLSCLWKEKYLQNDFSDDQTNAIWSGPTGQQLNRGLVVMSNWYSVM